MPRTAEPSSIPQPVPVNVSETTGALVIVAALPAVHPDDVEVEVVPEQVTIRAALRTDAPKDYLVHEWTYGPYERALEVPRGFGAGVEATLGHGQLAVRVLKGDAPASGIVVKPTAPAGQ